MVAVSASVNLPLHHKVQKFSYGTGSPRWSQKKGCKTVVECVVIDIKLRLQELAYFLFMLSKTQTIRYLCIEECCRIPS